MVWKTEGEEIWEKQISRDHPPFILSSVDQLRTCRRPSLTYMRDSAHSRINVTTVSRPLRNRLDTLSINLRRLLLD